MLSFERGRPIAIIKGGKYHNKIIHLYDPTKKCCDKCSEACKTSKNKCCEDCHGGCLGGAIDKPDINNNPLDIIGEDFIRSHKKKLSKVEMSKIKKALQKDIHPDEDYLDDIYNKSKKESQDRSKKEFIIYDDGVLQPLPNFEKTQRHYIAGPTESGKSYYIKKYLEQMKKVFPNKQIFIISDVDEDEELDGIDGVIRFELDKALVNKKPIKPEKFKDSIVIFDDIDSIQDPKLAKVITALRDSLLRRGRHDNITVLVTSHLMSNYKDTRIILNEANSITFFPRSGGTDAIKYTLKKYGNMNAKQIQNVLELPSRWVTLYKNYPNYIMYEKGIFLL